MQEIQMEIVHKPDRDSQFSMPVCASCLQLTPGVRSQNLPEDTDQILHE
eukprot:UN2651